MQPTLLERARTLFRLAPAPKTTAPVRGRAIPDQSLWEQFQRLGGGLTPRDVSTVIREADAGQTARLCDLANESRQKDCHLQSVLATREQALTALEWQLVIPGQDAESTRGLRQIRFARQALGDACNFQRAVAHLSGAFFHGYAVTEILWDKAGGKLVPVDFVNHAPRRFGFNLTTGKFIWRDQTTTHDGVDFVEKWPNKFIVSQPRVNGDVPCREGLVRVLMWAGLFRNWTLGDWLKLGEIAWKPWRTGEYVKGASEEDISNLVEVLERMSSSGVAVVPETTKLKVEWAGGGQGGSKSTHSELFDVVGREMSKAVLGQTLTTESGKVGSQALGKVHADVRKDILEADARHLEEVITRDIIAPLVRLNFGPTAPIPRFLFLTEDATNLLEFSAGVKNLAEAGLRVPQKWVRDQAGIPDPEEGEEVLGDLPEGEGPDEPEPDDPADDEPEEEDAKAAA